MMDNDNDRTEMLDPITNLAVELESIKKQLNDLSSINAEKDRQLCQLLNANKRLVAELSASKNSGESPMPKQDPQLTALQSFRESLNMTGDK